MLLIRHKNGLEIPWAFMGVQLCIKLFGLWRFGPLFDGDTLGYYKYSRQMTSATAWFFSLDLHREYLPISTLRMPGYPFLMAVFQAFSPVYWDVWLVLAQSLMTVLVSGVFLMFLLRWGVNGWLALVAAFWQAFCVRPEVDLSLLTDSLFNNLFLLVVLGLAWPGKSDKNPLPKTVLLGCLYALALLVREVAFYFLPLVAAGCFLNESKKTALKKLVVFMLPPLLVVAGVREWNRYRTGTPFLTLGGTTAFMAPMVLGGVEPFDENTLLDKTTRAHLAVRDFSSALRAIRALHDEHGLTLLEINALVAKKYRRSLSTHPLAHGRFVAANLARAAPLMLNPSLGVRLLAAKDALGRAAPLKPRFQEKYTSRDMVVFLLGSVPFLLLSAGLVAAFLALGLLLGFGGLLGHGPLPVSLAGVLLCWSLLTLGVLCFYSLINIEVRYLGAVSPLVTAGVVLLMRSIWPRVFSSAEKNA